MQRLNGFVSCADMSKQEMKLRFIVRGTWSIILGLLILTSASAANSDSGLTLSPTIVKAGDILTLKGKNSGLNSAKVVFSIGAQNVYPNFVDKDTILLVVPSLPAGTYAVRIVKNKKLVFSQDITIRPTGSGVIPPTGGTVELPGIASVIFPAGVFAASQLVQVEATSSPETAQDFQVSASIFRPGPRLSYEIRINTGNSEPLTNFQVKLNVPDSFLNSVPPGSDIQLFAQIWEDGGEELLDNFELFVSSVDRTAKTVQATLPPQAFTNRRRPDGTFEAIMTLSSTPGPATTNAGGSLQADDDCQGTSLGPPLSRPLEVTRPFNRAGETHPITGSKKPHYGTDFRASNGDDVLAVANGTVEQVGVQFNPRTGTGWGNYIVLRHQDGSATRYAHLMPGSPIAQGTQVQQGQVIAQADSSGGVTGPHLHLEYAPNGQIFVNEGKVDPFPCIGANISTSITVGDNGPVADDAFRVLLDDFVLGETTIGGTNTLAAGNLRPGNHTLKIIAIIAPDNAGTLGVSLADGVTFTDGTTARSATLPQGGQVSYVIVVPSQLSNDLNQSESAHLEPQQSTVEGPVLLSTLSLSQASAQKVNNSVKLVFSGRLEIGVATDPTRYVILVNGVPVKVERVSYKASTNSITLSLPNGSLQANDRVLVFWSNLFDTQRRLLTGQFGLLIPR